MEFLASLAIKALVGTSVCGTITVGTIYTCDKTLLGFAKDNPQKSPLNSGDQNPTLNIDTQLTPLVSRSEEKVVEVKDEPKEKGETTSESIVLDLKDSSKTLNVASGITQEISDGGQNSTEDEVNNNDETVSQTSEVSKDTIKIVGQLTEQELSVSKIVEVTQTNPSDETLSSQTATVISETTPQQVVN